MNCSRLVFLSLNRQAELQRIIRWAQRKRLAQPLKFYRRRLEDEQVRHARYALISPRAAIVARWVHFLTRPFRPTPRFYHKGSAAPYRTRKLDTNKIRHIVLHNN